MMTAFTERFVNEPTLEAIKNGYSSTGNIQR